MNALPFPLFYLDFEASGVGPQSYPIEVGLGLWGGADRPIVTWSALIKPALGWTEWNEASGRIHNIERGELATGLPVEIVARRLNELMAGGVAYSDAPAMEGWWAGRLYAAAGIEQTWAIGDADALLNRLDNFAVERRACWQERAHKAHRAGLDAERDLKGFARAIKARDVPVERRPL